MMIWKNNLVCFMFTIFVCSNVFHFLGIKYCFYISTVTGAKATKNKPSNHWNTSHRAIIIHGNQSKDENTKFNQIFLLKKRRQQEQQQQQQNVWYDKSIDRFARTVIDNTYQMHMEYDESYFDYNNNTIRSVDVQCDAFNYLGRDGCGDSRPNPISDKNQFPRYDSKTGDSTNNSTIEDGDLIVSDGEHVYVAYGKYLVVLDLSSGKNVRIVEVPKNNVTIPFYCGIDRYNEEILWIPYVEIKSLLLHHGRLVVVVSGYFEDNDDGNRIDRAITGYMSTLVQIYDTNILVQTNSSYIGMLSSNYINGYYKFARFIQNTAFVVTKSSLNTEPVLESPFRRYDDNNIELTDDEYVALVRSKTDEQIELFQQMLYRDLTSEKNPLPTIANINISLYDKSMTEEQVFQYILWSNQFAFIHSIDMMIEQSDVLAVKTSFGILIPDFYMYGSDNVIILASTLYPYGPYGPCSKTLIHAIQLVHNGRTPTQTTMSIAILPGYIPMTSIRGDGIEIFRQTLIRVIVDVSCLEQIINIPSKITSNIPSSVPFVVPDNIPLGLTSDFRSHVPSDIPSVAPINVPSDKPSDVQSDIPSTIPSDTPSKMPSTIVSDTHSIVPSDVPSNMPSTIPSDIPSIVPSDAPSVMPSTIPLNMPPVVTSRQTQDTDKRYMITLNISSNDVDVDVLKNDKWPGIMEEVSRIEFQHDSVQFSGNTVFGMTHLYPMVAYTYYNFTDPFFPKNITEFVFDGYEAYLYPLFDQQFGNKEIILVMNLDQKNIHRIKMIDISNPRNPVSLHNFSATQNIEKTDPYDGKVYREETTLFYDDSRYNKDGLLFMPIAVNSYYAHKTIGNRGYMVFSINTEDGIKELNHCQIFVDDSSVQYLLRKLDTAHEDNKCYYCYGGIQMRSLRFDDGNKWMITGYTFAMINIDNHKNNTTTCDKAWEETIDIPTPHANCCTETESDPFYEYCCRL